MAKFDWGDLKLFLALASHGTITHAARQLGISPPTASRRLADLERSLKTRLFDRLPNGLQLTETGRAAIDAARYIETGLTELEETIEAAANRRNRPVRVTSIASIATFLVLHIRPFLDELPPIEIISSGKMMSLARREADVALRMRAYPKEGDLTVRRLCTVRFTTYARKDLVAHGNPPTLSDFDPMNASAQVAWLDRLGESPRLRLNEMLLRYHGARAGLGMTLLPCFLGDADSTLRRTTEPPAALDEDVYMLMHRDRRTSPEVVAVAETLTEIFRAHRTALEGRPIEVERSSTDDHPATTLAEFGL